MTSPNSDTRLDGWQPIATAPKDGTVFQAWVHRPDTDLFPGGWEPDCRFNPSSEAFEIWGRVDYDQDGWDTYLHLEPTHWMPQPKKPLPPPPVSEEKP